MAIRIYSSKEVKQQKGIQNNAIKKNIKHEDHRNVLYHNKQMHHTMKTIRSHNHQLGSYEIHKVLMMVITKSECKCHNHSLL